MSVTRVLELLRYSHATLQYLDKNARTWYIRKISDADGIAEGDFLLYYHAEANPTVQIENKSLADGSISNLKWIAVANGVSLEV